MPMTHALRSSLAAPLALPRENLRRVGKIAWQGLTAWATALRDFAHAVGLGEVPLPTLRNSSDAAIVVLAMLALSPAIAPALEISPEMKKLAAVADKEGAVALMLGEGTFGGTEGAKLFEEQMNAAFGTRIKVVFTPGPSMPAMGSQIAMLANARQPAPTDIYVGWSRHLAGLAKYRLFLAADWEKLLPGRIGPHIAEQDGHILKVVTSVPGVFYNTRLSPYVPTTMADFLKPEWKGKIASTPYAANFDVLAANDVWGPQKAIDYARKLSSQIAGLMRCDEGARITSGEFLALVPNCAGRLAELGVAPGAPIANLTPRDFLAANYSYVAVPRNAPHPNAGMLFAAFALTPEGQSIVWQTWGSDLDLFPESHAHKEVADLEATYGTRLTRADATWQMTNGAGNKAWAEIQKILSQTN
jgi:ABC-type Fe3+ transport system substrate-binding protein